MRRSALKKAATAAVAALLAAGLGITGVQANYCPEYYDFSLQFADGDPYKYSAPQTKDNNSSGVISCDSNSELGFEAVMIGGGFETDFYLVSYNLMPGDSTYMINYVYESGYRSARLRGESCYDALYYTYGIWAADTY